MEQEWISLGVAIVTGSSTLIGVAITNYFNIKAIDKRHKFEAKENEKKIKLELRKEEYLGLAEDIYLLNAFIFGCINDKHSRADNNIVDRLNTRISKLQLISSNEISFEAEKVNVILMKVIFTLSLGLKKIVSLEYENDSLEKLANDYQQELNSHNSLFKEIKITELDFNKKIEKLELLHEDMLNTQQKIQKFHDEIYSNNQEIIEYKRQLLIEMIDSLKVVKPNLINLMNLMRADFGINESFEFNLDEYEIKYNEFKEFAMDNIDKINK